ncbi:PREDICTED: uncharacterized protein LOC107343549 isoform X6 [Acropora digitifera]|uniref:uncharacterized protein LOC107343549 isoform X6 n=1 Tax=Acropora digitifera TaxID=70779 RepID=UPI00077A60CF|nr:PREDICTED: uncharacterized protein LOC107343549 isoform X6 [Acropora digitifera]
MNLLKKWFVLSLIFHIVFLRHSLGNNDFSSFLDCDFENNTFCEWENDDIGRAAFKWMIWSGRAPSDMTGPQTTDASVNKNGKFAYMEASQRKQGDNVRLLSPKIQGENCLSLMYHMYGGSMGSLIIYLNTSSNETVEWIKSGNHPDQWFEAVLFFNTSVEYQIVLEGVRGSDIASNIAIDNITVQPGHCKRQVTLTMHAFIKEDGYDFKIDRVPAHSNWINQFSLKAVQTRNSSSDVMYFVYPGDKRNCGKSVTRQLFLVDFNCFPLDFFFASAINRSDYRKVLLFKQGQKLSYGIGLDDYPNCCGQTIEDYFYANLSLPRGISSHSVSHSPHSVVTGRSTYVTDGNVGSCLTIQRKNGRPPWVRITLNRKSFVYKIWIINRLNCCLPEIPELHIELENSEQTRAARCKVYNWEKQLKRLVICEPTIMATRLKIFAKGADNLTFCEVLVTSADDGLVAHGVLQEVWYNINYAWRGVISLQNDGRFPNAPDLVTVHEQFDVYDFDTKIYGQRLTAYLLIPESGNYTFYVACDDACTLMLHMNQATDKETEKVLLARTASSTYHNQWDRFPGQKSSETFLSKCQFYLVEMHMVQYKGKDSASVGVKLPNGTYERPIGKNRLLWVRPGNSFVDVKIPKKINVEAGRTFIIQGTYKYCYHGFYSPNCSIDLSLKFAKEKVLVHRALPMDCKEYKFNKSFHNVLWQERNYKVFVSYKHVDTEIPLPAISREVSEIFISDLSCYALDASHFSCPSGECLRADFLCDSNKNCKDGTDEIRCGLGMGCSKNKFSCADGGCVSWALTCNGEKDCEDGTDEPSFCKKQGEPSIWEITTTTTTATKKTNKTLISKMSAQILCNLFL